LFTGTTWVGCSRFSRIPFGEKIAPKAQSAKTLKSSEALIVLVMGM
jgi:hypothetical protein